MSTATKATHTPGPWSIHQIGSKSGDIAPNDDQPGWSFHDVTIGSGDRIVATASMHTLPERWAGYPAVETVEECEANARLIAAAPDLLLALTLLVGYLRRYEHWPVRSVHMAYLQPAESVIAKAEGGQ